VKRYARERARVLAGRVAGEAARTADSPDAEAVHDLRVSIRRLSACLREFAGCFPRKQRKRARRRLKRLMDLAAAVRDRDITLKLMARAGVAAGAAIRKRLAAQRTGAASALAAAAREWEETPLLADPPDEDLATASRRARRILPPMAERYFALGRELSAHEAAGPAEMHGFRLATKRLRYTLELFRPCYGPAMEKRLEELRAIQTYLGDLNDCDVARRLAGQVAPPGGRDRRRFEEYLAARAGKKASAFRRRWRDAFDAPGRERAWRAYLAR
jgi:CHAD domain-containing protein